MTKIILEAESPLVRVIFGLWAGVQDRARKGKHTVSIKVFSVEKSLEVLVVIT